MEHGAGDTVTFFGHVDEHAQARGLRGVVGAGPPSLKEGWGLVVGEAALAGTPTVAYRQRGWHARVGRRTARSGLLVDDQDGFVDALRRLLTDDELRTRLGEGARVNGARYTWAQTRAGFADVVEKALAGQRVAAD